MPSSGVHALLGIKVTSNLLVQATESIRTLKLPRREAVLTSNSVSEQPLPGGSQWYKKALTLTSSSSRFPTQAVYREAQQKEEGGSNSWGAWLRTGRRAKFGSEVVVTVYTSVEAWWSSVTRSNRTEPACLPLLETIAELGDEPIPFLSWDFVAHFPQNNT